MLITECFKGEELGLYLLVSSLTGALCGALGRGGWLGGALQPARAGLRLHAASSAQAGAETTKLLSHSLFFCLHFPVNRMGKHCSESLL